MFSQKQRHSNRTAVLNDFSARLHVVVYGTGLSAEPADSTPQEKKKGGVAIEPAFIGKSAYSRKAGVLIL